MGPLFWKFLAAFWLAILLAYGGMLALSELTRQQQPGQPLGGPSGRLQVITAQQLLQQGGAALLLPLLQQWQQQDVAFETLLVVDAQQQELLHRPLLAAELAGHATAPGGQQFRLYLQRRLPPHHAGAAGKAAIPGSYTRTDSTVRPGGGLQPAPADIGKLPAPPRFWLHPMFLPIVVVVASIAASLWLAWYFAAPVRQLRQALQVLPQQQWQTQLSAQMTGRRDEFGGLARNFNQMAQQVYQAILSQRRLLHDVSHELRSPLARLQILIGLLRQQPADLQVSLDKIEAEAERLDQLVGQILTFSRLDSGQLTPQLQRLPLHEMLASVADDAALEAEPRQQTVLLALPAAPVGALADAELLFRALENVVRNAIKYAGDGAVLRISLQITGNQADIRVSDNGAGVEPAALEHLFDPFFRAAQQGDGVGLGLSIAARAVTACGGQIRAWNEVDADGTRCGFTVQLLLPLT